MRSLRTILVVAALCLTVSPQVRSQAVPPLSAGERIAPARPLTVTLRLGSSRVAIGEVPTFTVVIRNSGRAPLLLNPAAVSNIQIFTRAGDLVPRARGGIADYAFRMLKRFDFISLGPGQTREFVVAPDFHALEDYSQFATYLDGFSLPERRLKVPTGEYLVRLTYLAFPDYAASSYDVADVAEAWEGLVEAPAVPLTVLPLPDDKVRDALARIDNEDRPLASIELLRLGRVTRAIDPLLRLFARSRDLRTTVAHAVVSIDAALAAPRLIAAIAALPEQDRADIVATQPVAEAARVAPGCAAVPLVVQALEDVGHDVGEVFGDSLRSFADKCPELRVRFISLIRTPVPAPAAYQGAAAAYSRRRAAEALGRIGNPDDVPLLIAMLRREIPGLPPATNFYADPAREGAARALGRLGGAQAAAALSEQLNDRAGNRFTMPVIVEQLGRLNSAGTADVLTRLLDSPDQSLLVRVLITLRQLRDTSAIPQLLKALSHPNPTVRTYASGALLEVGAAVAQTNMRPALDDRDDNVRANAMFHLARYGDATALPVFVRGITSDVQFIREASVQGIAKFGIPETFTLLRAALETASERSAPYIRAALFQLTFASIAGANSLAAWDGWWKTHAQTTRLQWAEEALDARVDNRNAGSPTLAVRYIATIQPLPRSPIERGLNHRSWMVRDAAIDAVQGYDRPRAAALLLRELDSRYLGACRNAIRRLSELTGDKATFNCMTEADRQRARARWATRADR